MRSSVVLVFLTAFTACASPLESTPGHGTCRSAVFTCMLSNIQSSNTGACMSEVQDLEKRSGTIQVTAHGNTDCSGDTQGTTSVGTGGKQTLFNAHFAPFFFFPQGTTRPACCPHMSHSSETYARSLLAQPRHYPAPFNYHLRVVPCF